ncbi:MAG: TrkH family potassium uptake protein [Paludibacteraceae bacterium]
MAEKKQVNGYIKRLGKLTFTLSWISFILAIIDLGFLDDSSIDLYFILFYTFTIIASCTFTAIRYFFFRKQIYSKILVIDGLIFIFYIGVFIYNSWLLGTESIHSLNNTWTYLALFLSFVRETYNINYRFKYKIINPALLFVCSFLLIIVMGSLLLMLPNASNGTISYIDALFTATSAVCVTGLIVVDTATFFTPLGQTVIIFLIQIGGLGIMTFTSYFSFFFKKSASFENQMYMGEITSVDRLDDVFKTLKTIIVVTFTIELIGAIFIFFSMDAGTLPKVGNRIFFSIFHSISAFCNAGFSTLTNGLYELPFRFNYPFQLIISFLIIFGGIGFSITFNIYKYFVYKITNTFKKIFRQREKTYLPWILSLNSKIIITTTTVLIVVGILLVFFLERDNTLIEHGLFGKIVIAFSTAVTPRTAGFNSVDFAQLSLPVTLIVIILMWIGASPGSTGGGIKTSTFAISVLNIISLAKGKKNLVVFSREISQNSINRAFAIISLSMGVLFLAILGLVISDGDKNLIDIVFESFSAYSTVGLSRGITASLSTGGKIIVTLTMFLGRISTLTLLVALVKKARTANFRYPEDKILIN